MIVATLPYPPSGNHYKSHRIVKPRGAPAFVSTYVTNEAKAYFEQVAWLLKSAGVREIIKGRVQIDIVLYAQRPQDWQKRQRLLGAHWNDSVRRMDLDNARKCVYDALKNVAFEDDFWVWKDSGEVAEPDEHGARVVVTITALSVEQPQTQLALA